jgi:hypothetical protein
MTMRTRTHRAPSRVTGGELRPKRCDGPEEYSQGLADLRTSRPTFSMCWCFDDHAYTPSIVSCDRGWWDTRGVVAPVTERTELRIGRLKNKQTDFEHVLVL